MAWTLPTSHDYSPSRTEHMHPVTSKILEQLHEPQSSTCGFRRISAKPLGYSQDTCCSGLIDFFGLATDGFQRALALTTSFGCHVDQIVSNILFFYLYS